MSTQKISREEILKMSNAESNRFTKECICTALIYLMSTLPFEKITITSIIKRAGVSRGGFYRNFSSKEDVLEEIGLQLSASLTPLLSKETFLANPYKWYNTLFVLVTQQKEYFQLLIQAKIPPDLILYPSLTHQPQLQDLPIIKQYRQLAFQKALTAVLIHWFKNGLKESPEEMADLCMELFSLYHPN